jgi:hypothetical protein
MVKEKVGDAPLDFLMDSTTNPKVKTTKGKGLKVHSLARNILSIPPGEYSPYTKIGLALGKIA